MIRKITQISEYEQVIDSPKPVLIDFYATWCEPCKILDEVLERINGRLPEDGQIFKLDIDDFPELSVRYSIRSVPVLLWIKSGEVLWRMNGFEMDEPLLQMIRKVSRETVK